MPAPLRITLHLTAADRELLNGIEQRRLMAEAQRQQADRDFAVAGTGMATSRGIRGANVIELQDAGLIVELAPSAEADAVLPARVEDAHGE